MREQPCFPSPPSLSRLLPYLLPILFLAPEVLKVGGIYPRMDYIFLPIGLLLLFHRFAFRDGLRTGFGYTPMGLLIIVAVMAFGMYSLGQVPHTAFDLGGAIKYAIWPIKTLVWALLLREVLCITDAPKETFYRVVAVTTVALFGIQLLELSSASFRGLLGVLYPMQATDRLGDISYRARGVFGGYDAASIYFLFAGVVIHKLSEASAKRMLLLAMAGAGAFMAARTGFLLLIGYLAVASWLSASAGLRRRYMLVAAVAAAGVWGLSQLGDGDEGSLTGRYLEVVKVITSGGDLSTVNSFYGTLYMNWAAFAAGYWDPWWGNGVDPGTTADQLYAKYLYMLGGVGLLFWGGIHVSMLFRSGYGNDAALAYAAVAFAVLIAIAHAKGGNYYFASRLGDLALLLVLLAHTQWPATAAPANA
jgi:hypothetical protein